MLELFKVFTIFFIFHKSTVYAWQVRDLTKSEEQVKDFMIGVNETIINTCKQFIPQISLEFHKGQLGRIGVFGGSVEYTGAPFFGAMAALRTGADMSYIFCVQSAAVAIKSYSPELMVLPCLDMDDPIERMKPWLIKLNALLIGPGLGRHDKNVTENIIKIIKFAKNLWDESLPLIIDADGFFILYDHPDLLKGYPGQIYLTPNIVEFVELASIILQIDKKNITPKKHLRQLATKFGPKVLILLKGREDQIAQCDIIVTSLTQGSARRCGGQGDLLAGCLATFAAWIDKSEYSDCGAYTPEILAAFSASSVVKLANKLAFQKKGRGLIASDMLDNMHLAYDMLFSSNSLSNMKQ